MATDYRQWEMEVTEDSTRRMHLMKYGGPRSTGTVTGVSTVKIPVGRLFLATAGSLTLRIRGLAADGDYSIDHVVLARPHLARMAPQIVVVVFCGVGTLLSLLWGLWLIGFVKAL